MNTSKKIQMQVVFNALYFEVLDAKRKKWLSETAVKLWIETTTPTYTMSELSDAQSEDRSQATNLLTQVHRGP
jgi:hypothetical protein